MVMEIEQGRQITKSVKYVNDLLKNIDAMLENTCMLDIMQAKFVLYNDKNWCSEDERFFKKEYISPWFIRQFHRYGDEFEILTVGVLLYDPTYTEINEEPICIVSRSSTVNLDTDDIFWIGIIQGFCPDMRNENFVKISALNAEAHLNEDLAEENEFMSKAAFDKVLGDSGQVISIAKPLRDIKTIEDVEVMIKMVLEIK
jgi:hypothetical protein